MKQKGVYFIILNLVLSVLSFGYLVSAASPVEEGGVGGGVGVVSGFLTPEGDKVAKVTVTKAAGGTSKMLSAKIPGGARIFTKQIGDEITKVTTDILTKNPDGTFLVQQGSSKISLTAEELIAQGLDPSKMNFKGPISQNMFANFLGLEAGTALDALVTGFQWSVLAYGLGYLIGGIAGLNEDNTQALGLSLGAGAFVWKG